MVRDIIPEYRNFKMADQKRADAMVDHVAAGIFDHCLAGSSLSLRSVGTFEPMRR
jgi:nucleoid DNA-binding protein